MKARTLALSLALAASSAAFAFAQSPHMGTWKLDEAKSHIPAGAQKNTTVTYEAAANDQVRVTTDGVDGNGAPIHTEWTGKFDGRDYPLTGDSGADSRAYKVVNDHTLTMTNKKAHKVAVTGRIVVAPDGRTRTLTANIKDPSGQTVTETAVYNKQ